MLWAVKSSSGLGLAAFQTWKSFQGPSWKLWVLQG